MIIPFIGKISTKIAHCIRRTTDIEICYKPIKKLSIILNNKKRTTKDAVGIYKFICLDCVKIHIGEAGKNIQTRAKKHPNDAHCKSNFRTLFVHTRKTI